MPQQTSLKESTIQIQQESIPPPAYTTVNIQQPISTQEDKKKSLFVFFLLEEIFLLIFGVILFIISLIFPVLSFIMIYTEYNASRIPLLFYTLIYVSQIVVCISLITIFGFLYKITIVSLILMCMNNVIVLTLGLVAVCNYKFI
jgi:hypothetical protein